VKRTPRELALFRENKRLRVALEDERAARAASDAKCEHIAKAMSDLLDFVAEWRQEQENPF